MTHVTSISHYYISFFFFFFFFFSKSHDAHAPLNLEIPHRNRRAAPLAALVIYIIVVLVATPQAQQPTAFAPGGVARRRRPRRRPTPPRSTCWSAARPSSTSAPPISRVSLTVPDVADAMVTAPQQLLIHGKTPGTISLFVWDRAGGIKTYEVSVRRDLTHSSRSIKELFPGEPITVMGSGKDVVLSGTVSSKYVIDKAAEVAGGYVEKKEYVVNLLKQQEGVASNQVMLRVRFAEVSRSALHELGVVLHRPTGYKDDVVRRAASARRAVRPAPDVRRRHGDDGLSRSATS